VTDTFQILGIPGSLRRHSMNRSLLRAAQAVVPDGVSLDIHDIGGIPLFNADVEAEGNPPAVREFRARIRAADALLIATPEYNYSIPGVLKNAIDWASRTVNDPPSPLRHKPVALIGASGGMSGTVRSQLALRQVFLNTESFVMLKPELIIPSAAALFDADGTLTDAAIIERIRTVVISLVDWTKRLHHD
jgi:chromate reductase, NAD(P)H dehydrogenase (quinone)